MILLAIKIYILLYILLTLQRFYNGVNIRQMVKSEESCTVIEGHGQSIRRPPWDKVDRYFVFLFVHTSDVNILLCSIYNDVSPHLERYLCHTASTINITRISISLLLTDVTNKGQKGRCNVVSSNLESLLCCTYNDKNTH